MNNIKRLYLLVSLLFTMAFSYAETPVSCDVKVVQDHFVTMLKLEQEIREEHYYKSLDNLYVPTYKTDIALHKVTTEMHRIDQENQNSLDLIVNHCGWIDVKTYGEKTADTAFLIVHHANKLEYRLQYLPFILQAYEKGELRALYYAWFIDRNLRKQNLPQRYGTQEQLGKSGKEVFGAVEEPMKLNARRAELGLAPINGFNEN